jgi:hypothetical protein
MAKQVLFSLTFSRAIEVGRVQERTHIKTLGLNSPSAETTDVLVRHGAVHPYFIAIRLTSAMLKCLKRVMKPPCPSGTKRGQVRFSGYFCCIFLRREDSSPRASAIDGSEFTQSPAVKKKLT